MSPLAHIKQTIHATIAPFHIRQFFVYLTVLFCCEDIISFSSMYEQKGYQVSAVARRQLIYPFVLFPTIKDHACVSNI